MLKLTFIEFFLRTIPESFAIIWGVLVISKKHITKIQYVIFSLSSALVTFLVRYLPIHLGIHTIITTIFIISIGIIIGIPIIKSIISVFILTLLLLISELINMLILNFINYIFNININKTLTNTYIKCVFELPSLVFLIGAILLIQTLLNKNKNINNSINSE